MARALPRTGLTALPGNIDEVLSFLFDVDLPYLLHLSHCAYAASAHRTSYTSFKRVWPSFRPSFACSSSLNHFSKPSFRYVRDQITLHLSFALKLIANTFCAERHRRMHTKYISISMSSNTTHKLANYRGVQDVYFQHSYLEV